MLYAFNRNGAIVCNRDSKEEALDYARKIMGWDLHQGKHQNRDEFGGIHPVSYKVEEHELLPTDHPDRSKNCWKRTYQDETLNLSDAIHPFPSTNGT